MREPEDGSQTAFEQFRQLFSRAQAEEKTGDATLDMLLLAVTPALARIIQDLAIPHWFNDELIAMITDVDSEDQSSEALKDVVALSFVRSHPRGYVYHDTVRESFRQYLARTDPLRAKELSCRLMQFFTRQCQRDGAEEFIWERVYHTLACDEAAGFEYFDALFQEARRNRRFTVCATLVNMAGEQRILLSSQGNARIDYYRGRLALSLHQFDDAAEIFGGMAVAKLPPPLIGRVQLYRGLAFEAKGMYQQAEQVYRVHLESPGNTNGTPDLSARFHQRLAATFLSQGNLRKAEAHARMSLEINERIRDRHGESLNFEILGRIYGELRDLSRAQNAFEKSLSLLDSAGQEFGKARVYSDLADFYSSFGKWQEAEACYRQALQIKTDAGDTYGLAFIYSNLGKLCLKSGDTEAALRYFRASQDLFEQFNDRLNLAQVLRNLSLTYARNNDIGSALDCMRKAVEALPAESPWVKMYRNEVGRLGKRLNRGKVSSWRRIGIISGIVAAVVALLLLILMFLPD